MSSSETEAGPRSRRLNPAVQLALVLALALALGVVLLLAGVGHRSAPPPQLAPAPRGVFKPTAEERAGLTYVPVRAQSFAVGVVTDGRVAVDDDRTTQVFPPFTGRVTRLFVSAGQPVRRGQPLASFAANELVQAQSDLASASAAEAQARAQLAQAQSNFIRQSALVAQDAAARRDFEQSRTDLATARQAVLTAQSNTQSAKGRLEVLNLTAQVPALTAAVRSGRFRSQATLTSPISGVVTARAVGVGQFVSSVASGAAQPLMTVSDLSRVWLVANLREADAASVRAGQTISARIPALGGRVVTGRINYVAAAVDPNTRRLPVHAEVPNPGGALRPEMFAEMTLSTGAPQVSLSVPASAVVYDGPKTRVWVAGPGGALTLHDIQTGRTEGGYVQVLSGLQAGDRVVGSGALFIDQASEGQ